MPCSALFAIPVAWLLAIMPRGYSMVMYASASKSRLDPRNPRGFPQQISGNQSIPAVLRGRIGRAENAQLNSFENLGFYAAAVVAGYAANINSSVLNGLAWTYIGSRLVYNYVYIYNDKFSPYVRTGVHMFGVALIFCLFILAGIA